ncbi:MAG TPA: pyridoxal-phosphate dependent enzyme [Kofleriaceae bacterium]|jgi:threonine dehydratase|nr:pyridoxal-phosphate dependent enzyme [Kofleriaceae bacterium]
MGTVYTAYDPELDRNIALKILHRQARTGDRARAQILAEAQAMARISHPGVVAIGVESSDGPAMQRSVAAGRLETIDCGTIIDGLRVRRVGEITFSVVQRFVDDIVALPDRDIFEAMIWVMERCKLVVEGAAAAPVAALLHGLIKLPAGSRVAVVLSGGNLNLDQLRGLSWN